MFSVVIVILLLSAVSAYSKCSPSDVKGPITIPISKVLMASPIVVSGNIEIVDGCTFKVTDFIFYNAHTSKWYGGTQDNADGVTLSDDNINPSSSKGEQTFKFRNVAGAQVSFRDFSEFRLFDQDTKLLVATAKIPSNLTSTVTLKPQSSSSTDFGYVTILMGVMLLFNLYYLIW